MASIPLSPILFAAKIRGNENTPKIQLLKNCVNLQGLGYSLSSFISDLVAFEGLMNNEHLIPEIFRYWRIVLIFSDSAISATPLAPIWFPNFDKVK